MSGLNLTFGMGSRPFITPKEHRVRRESTLGSNRPGPPPGPTSPDSAKGGSQASEGSPRLLVVANRLPVSARLINDGSWLLEVRRRPCRRRRRRRRRHAGEEGRAPALRTSGCPREPDGRSPPSQLALQRSPTARAL